MISGVRNIGILSRHPSTQRYGNPYLPTKRLFLERNDLLEM